MLTYVDHAMLLNQSGLAFRHHQDGRELDLIQSFLSHYTFSPPEGCHITVFKEPRLESGFPDLVIATWDVRVARKWPAARSKLGSLDLRLMHFLVQNGPTTFARLESFFSHNLRDSLERLEMAEMVSAFSGSWSARPLDESFGVRDILAIEAKINKWENVLLQASRNTWFASQSYILVKRLPSRVNLLERVSNLGIGIWTLSQQLVKAAVARRNALPRSYASWLFNEWIWRIANNTA